MKKLRLLLGLCTVLCLSCTDRDDNVSLVNIRIKNDTKNFFNEVRVAQGDTVYSNIAAGDYSEYLEYEKAFQTATLTILTDSMSLNYIPTEAMTDSLPIGFYTYEISIDDENQVGLAFKIDE